MEKQFRDYMIEKYILGVKDNNRKELTINNNAKLKNEKEELITKLGGEETKN
jgi:hypothetical protein